MNFDFYLLSHFQTKVTTVIWSYKYNINKTEKKNRIEFIEISVIKLEFLEQTVKKFMLSKNIFSLTILVKWLLNHKLLKLFKNIFEY